jgi:phosphate-selective porin
MASNEIKESAKNNNDNNNNTKLNQEKVHDRKKQKRRRHIGIKLHFTNFDKKRIKKIDVVYNYAITHDNSILTGTKSIE